MISPAAGPVVGIVANPLAGKDVRRLTSGASPISDSVKIGVIRRAVVGAFEGGAEQVLISGDRARLGERALVGLTVPGHAEVLSVHGWNSGRDTQLTAAQFRAMGVGAVVALGGDGTQRDVAQGWRDAPLVPLAVGTNNVFPAQTEATVAGFAAGAVASGLVQADEVTARAKVIEVRLGIDAACREAHDVALVDVCLVRSAFVGARAVWDPASVSEIVAAIAEPASVGLSAIAAVVAPVGRQDPGGAHVRLAHAAQDAQPARRVRAAVMPGSYSDIAVEHCRRLDVDEPVRLAGPGVLTLDGEREIVLQRGQTADVSISAQGPHVIDVGAAVASALRKRYSFEAAVAGR